MTKKSIVLSIAVIFVFVFVFEMIFHGFLLRDLYIETATLWRSTQEMQSFFPLSTGVQILFTTVFVLFYNFIVKDFNIRSALTFGVFIGLLFAISQFGLYAYMPIPIGLALAWFVGIFIESVLMGLIIGLMNKR